MIFVRNSFTSTRGNRTKRSIQLSEEFLECGSMEETFDLQFAKANTESTLMHTAKTSLDSKHITIFPESLDLLIFIFTHPYHLSISIRRMQNPHTESRKVRNPPKISIFHPFYTMNRRIANQ